MTLAAMGGQAGIELRDAIVEHATSVPLGNQQALLEVARLCGSPTSRAQDVAQAAAHDEGFTALLLRIGNSAYSGSSTRISSLSVAVTRLGFRLVHGLALAAPGLGLLVATRDELAGHRLVLHRHSVRAGIVARELARTPEEAERALAAGLVHNLGLTVLSVYAKPQFVQLAQTAAEGHQLRPVEEEVLGFTHAELGGLVGSHGGYPAELVTAIVEHDEQHPATGLAALVQVADLLVREHGSTFEPARRLPTPAFAAVGVDPARVRDRVGELLRHEDGVDADDESASPDEPGCTHVAADVAGSALGGLV